MDPKILSALGSLLRAFAKLGVPYQVGGSVASSIHGVPRSSLDISYMKTWASELRVADLLERAFIETGLDNKS